MTTYDVPPGAAWSLRVRRSRQVRFTALADGANLSLLVLSAGDPVDRLNLPDTLKAQMSACLAPPMVLMSDRGLALMSMTGSSLAWHDALGGHSCDLHVERFGTTSYALHGNDRRISARAGLLSELRKHGRGRADLHATVNLFSKVGIDDEGGLRLVDGHARAGDWATLRADLDVLLVLSTAPHPLAQDWSPGAVRVEIGDAPDDDGPRSFRDESARALAQSALVCA